MLHFRRYRLDTMKIYGNRFAFRFQLFPFIFGMISSVFSLPNLSESIFLSILTSFSFCCILFLLSAGMMYAAKTGRQQRRGKRL